jgi:PAS domain S-box-containing protein
MKNSIQIRLALAFIGLAVVPLVLVGLIQSWQSSAVQSQQVLEFQREVAQRAATQAAAFIHELENELHVTARTQDLMDLGHDDQRTALSKLQSYKDVFEDLALLDGEGRELARVSRRAAVTAADLGERSQKDEFLIPMTSGETYYGLVAFNVETGEPFMTMAVPIMDVGSGLAKGVLVADVRLKAIWDLIASIRVGETGSAYIVGREGRLIAHRNPSVVLRGTEFDLPDQDGIQQGLEGTEVVLAMAKIPLGERAFTVVAERPVSEALATVVALRNTVLGIGVVAALVVGLLGVLFARTLTRPLRQLVVGAQEIGRGNLDYRIEVETRDEIGQLSQAFNQMTENLQAITASRDELNTEIAERKRAEEKYGLIIKTALDGFWISDLKGRFLEANESYCNMVGYTREELLTMSIPDIEALEKPEEIAQRIKKIVEQGSDRFETRHIHKDGKILDVEVSINYVMEEGQFFVFIRDITERKRAEEARVKAVSAVVDAMGDALLLHTLDGEIIFVNPAYEKITGYEKSELVGRDAAEVGAKVTKPEDAEITAASIEAALKGEALMPAPVTLVSKEGRETPTAFTVSFMKDAAGEPTTAVVVLKDITEIKRTEDKLKQSLAELEASRKAALNMMTDAEMARRAAELANEDLEREIAERLRVEAELARSNRELEQFAYVASHDLQEPLRKVQVFGERLKAKQAHAFDEQGLDYLERMQDAARRMQRMINDLLTFSRVATRVEPFVPVDLCRVAREAVSDLEIQIERTGGRIVIGDLPTLEADPSQMRQLLENLIGNGLKFHRQGVAPVVEITSKRIEGPEGELCQVLVKDNGIGFDEKYLDRIFKPFQRLHGRGKYPGTGIGLAICRRIAERHGGDITAHSAPGAGATFIVTLPVKQGRREWGVGSRE